MSQQLEANRASARIRTERTSIKRAIWTGQIDFADVDLDAPELQRMRVAELLAFLPVGRYRRTDRQPRGNYDRAERLLWSFRASSRVTIGSLTTARKDELRALVAARLPRREGDDERA